MMNSSTAIGIIIHTEEYRIVSKQGNLYMIDTKNIRGMLVDLCNSKIIVPGFEENITEIEYDELPEGKYYLGREGIHIYIYKYQGKICICDRNTMNNEDIILRTKIRNVGLDVGSLFSENVETSRFSYHYIISHRDDIIASKINMFYKEGFAYLVEQHVISSDTDETCPLILFPELSVPKATAIDFLTKGYHNDVVVHDNPLLQLGEFINVYSTDGNCTRVISKSYRWRKKIRDNELKVRYGFYKHLTLAMKAKKESNTKKLELRPDLEEYNRLFPFIPYVEPRSIETYIKSHGFILTWPKIGKLIANNYIYNTWACYLQALPLHLHQEAYNLYNDYFKVCDNCYKFIVELRKAGLEPIIHPNMEDSIAIRRIDDIIKQSNKNIGDTGSFEKNCQNLIKKERGSSLFAINEYVIKNTC